MQRTIGQERRDRWRKLAPDWVLGSAIAMHGYVDYGCRQGGGRDIFAYALGFHDDYTFENHMRVLDYATEDCVEKFFGFWGKRLNLSLGVDTSRIISTLLRSFVDGYMRSRWFSGYSPLQGVYYRGSTSIDKNIELSIQELEMSPEEVCYEINYGIFHRIKVNAGIEPETVKYIIHSEFYDFATSLWMIGPDGLPLNP